MFKYCSVPMCSNSSLMPGINFHRFPTETKMKTLWVTQIGLDNKWVARFTMGMRVCSSHFLESDYVFQGGKKCLNQQAVPSVFQITQNEDLMQQAITQPPDVTSETHPEEINGNSPTAMPPSEQSEPSVIPKTEDFSEFVDVDMLYCNVELSLADADDTKYIRAQHTIKNTDEEYRNDDSDTESADREDLNGTSLDGDEDDVNVCSDYSDSIPGDTWDHCYALTDAQKLSIRTGIPLRLDPREERFRLSTRARLEQSRRRNLAALRKKLRNVIFPGKPCSRMSTIATITHATTLCRRLWALGRKLDNELQYLQRINAKLVKQKEELVNFGLESWLSKVAETKANEGRSTLRVDTNVMKEMEEELGAGTSERSGGIKRPNGRRSIRRVETNWPKETVEVGTSDRSGGIICANERRSVRRVETNGMEETASERSGGIKRAREVVLGHEKERIIRDKRRKRRKGSRWSFNRKGNHIRKVVKDNEEGEIRGGVEKTKNEVTKKTRVEEEGEEEIRGVGEDEGKINVMPQTCVEQEGDTDEGETETMTGSKTRRPRSRQKGL